MILYIGMVAMRHTETLIISVKLRALIELRVLQFFAGLVRRKRG